MFSTSSIISQNEGHLQGQINRTWSQVYKSREKGELVIIPREREETAGTVPSSELWWGTDSTLKGGHQKHFSEVNLQRCGHIFYKIQQGMVSYPERVTTGSGSFPGAWWGKEREQRFQGQVRAGDDRSWTWQNSSHSRTQDKEGKEEGWNTTFMSSILPVFNWKSEGKGPGVAVYQPAARSTEQVKKGGKWSLDVGLLENIDIHWWGGLAEDWMFFFSFQWQENYKRNFILRYNIACNYMLDTFVN